MADERDRSLERQVAVGDEEAQRQLLIRKIQRGSEVMVSGMLLTILPRGDFVDFAVVEKDGSTHPVVRWRPTAVSSPNYVRDTHCFDLVDHSLVEVIPGRTSAVTMSFGGLNFQNIYESPFFRAGEMFAFNMPRGPELPHYERALRDQFNLNQLRRSRTIVVPEGMRAQVEAVLDQEMNNDHTADAIRYAAEAARQNMERQVAETVFGAEYPAEIPDFSVKEPDADPEAED
jgi:hypothetical protein